jgi:rhodanese-related sulfurtransferase
MNTVGTPSAAFRDSREDTPQQTAPAWEHAMKLFASIITLIALVATPLLAAEPTHTKDSLETVQKNLNDDKAQLVDVREQVEWDAGHVQGAIHLPMSEMNNEARLAEMVKRLDKKKPVYTYCKAGVRALNSAEFLEQHDFEVRPLKAGYAKLLEAGFPKADNKDQ